MSHRRPEITEEKIQQINDLIKANPGWHRSKLSEMLCELWDWKSEIGQLKSISCRDLLRALDAAGRIELPPQKKAARKVGTKALIQLRFHDTTPIERSLKDITPLSVEIADTSALIEDFKSYIEQYHYLAYGQSVGECMRYIVRSKEGNVLACLLYGSSAWRCSARDNFIGWSDDERLLNLHLTTNNTRFLILPFVRVPHLASHILSLISHRISCDWQIKYGHPVYLLETFVEKHRFQGISYRAANWINVGETTGRGRDSLSHCAALPVKGVYVYPLVKDFRKKLSGRRLPRGKGRG
jgi:hypothetical protein